MSSPTSGRRVTDWTTTAFSLVLLLAWDASGLDLAIIRRFGDMGGFALRNHWLTSGLMHEGGRILAWAVLALLALNVWRPLATGLGRTERWQWLLVTVLCLTAVPALKRISATSCPWELAEFGGTAVYLSHWRVGIPDGGSGHCFPSGHAASAFGFLWGWFAMRDARPELARTWLGGVVLFGVLFGTAQSLRGAHYPSHTLWTAWLCWTACVMVASVQRRCRLSQSPREHSVGLSRMSHRIGNDAA